MAAVLQTASISSMAHHPDTPMTTKQTTTTTNINTTALIVGAGDGSLDEQGNSPVKYYVFYSFSSQHFYLTEDRKGQGQLIHFNGVCFWEPGDFENVLRLVGLKWIRGGKGDSYQGKIVVL